MKERFNFPNKSHIRSTNLQIQFSLPTYLFTSPRNKTKRKKEKREGGRERERERFDWLQNSYCPSPLPPFLASSRHYLYAFATVQKEREAERRRVRKELDAWGEMFVLSEREFAFLISDPSLFLSLHSWPSLPKKKKKDAKKNPSVHLRLVVSQS